jgi:hypothetical protein
MRRRRDDNGRYLEVLRRYRRTLADDRWPHLRHLQGPGNLATGSANELRRQLRASVTRRRRPRQWRFSAAAGGYWQLIGSAEHPSAALGAFDPL